MTNQTEYEPFAGIISKALEARGAAKGDLSLHPEHRVPAYVVRMCVALTQALNSHGNEAVTLDEVIRLERTCTGADYHHKFALRCHRLALRAAA